MHSRLATALLAAALLASPAARAAPGDLVVGDGWVAMTGRDYGTLVVLDTRAEEISARIDLRENGSIMRHAGVESAAAGSSPIKLLSDMDPGTRMTSSGSALTHFVTVLDGLPYSKPADVRWVIERPGSMPTGRWDRIVSLEPPIFYDSTDTRVALGREIVDIDTEHVRTGNGEARADIIPDLARDRLFVPTWRAGRAGVAMIDTGSGHLLEFQLPNRHFGNHGVVSADGKLLYVASEGVWVVDLLSRRVLGEVKLPYPVSSMALSPDGAQLYLLDAKGRLFEARDARTLRRLWHAVVSLER